MNASQRIQEIEAKLNQALSPSHLVVIDESHRHIGHEGAKTGLGHFAIQIRAEKLAGKTRMQQHRLIYQALGSLMQTDIHALRIEIND